MDAHGTRLYRLSFIYGVASYTVSWGNVTGHRSPLERWLRGFTEAGSLAARHAVAVSTARPSARTENRGVSLLFPSRSNVWRWYTAALTSQLTTYKLKSRRSRGTPPLATAGRSQASAHARYWPRDGKKG